MATIVDVAALANVSTSTVSHVVNGTRHVNEQTRERVLKAIAETGYRQHSVARALRRSRTDIVGLVISDVGYPVLDQMVLGIEHRASLAGMTVLLVHSGDTPEQELASVIKLRDHRVDGVLLTPVAGSDPIIPDALAAAEVPLVLVDRPSAMRVDQVGVRNVEPMRELTTHLLELGHTRVAFVSRGGSVATLEQRRRGFDSALTEAGRQLDDGLVVSVADGPAATAAVRALLESPRPPTAMVCASQRSAAHALEAVEDLGLRVPEDLALVTFDDFPLADLLRPRLTAAVQPSFEIGQEAVNLLLHRMAAPDSPLRSVSLEPELRHRESCGCPPGTPWPAVG